jgi:hypothetical protein
VGCDPLRVPPPEQPAGELGAAEQRPALMREQTLADLYAARETSGHPESVHREGRRLYWDEAEAMAWAQERNRRRRPRSPRSLTPVDRSGEPDELVDAEEAARILGYASPRTISSYLARNVATSPTPTTSRDGTGTAARCGRSPTDAPGPAAPATPRPGPTSANRRARDERPYR